MKNTFLCILTCLVMSGLAQQDRSWRLGVQWGIQGNHSEFTGGMENANARFHHNPYGAGALDFIARYDHNKHWMLMSGLGFSSSGFEFALAENYSVLKEENHFSRINTKFGSVSIPLMAFYKFDPNCKGSKWLVGAGYSHTFIGGQSINKNFVEGTEGNTNSNYLRSEAVAKGGMSTMLRFSVGREKVFKRGSILNASMLFNVGLKEIATAKVVYTVDGEEYTHDFSNKGNFIGFRLSYFFKTFQKSELK